MKLHRAQLTGPTWKTAYKFHTENTAGALKFMDSDRSRFDVLYVDGDGHTYVGDTSPENIVPEIEQTPDKTNSLSAERDTQRPARKFSVFRDAEEERRIDKGREIERER